MSLRPIRGGICRNDEQFAPIRAQKPFSAGPRLALAWGGFSRAQHSRQESACPSLPCPVLRSIGHGFGPMGPAAAWRHRHDEHFEPAICLDAVHQALADDHRSGPMLPMRETTLAFVLSSVVFLQLGRDILAVPVDAHRYVRHQIRHDELWRALHRAGRRRGVRCAACGAATRHERKLDAGLKPLRKA